jgi:hypothetical protein
MFTLSEDQNKKLAEWIDAKNNPDAYTGAIGGRWKYCFTPTSLGIVTRVVDTLDNSEIDLTDYDMW